MKDKIITETIAKNVLKISKNAVLGTPIKPETLTKSILTNTPIPNLPPKIQQVVPAINSYIKASEAIVKASPENLTATYNLVNYLPFIAHTEKPAESLEKLSKQLSIPDSTKIQMQKIFDVNSGHIDVQQFFTFNKNPELARLFSRSFTLDTPPITPAVYTPVLRQTSVKSMAQAAITNTQIFVKSVNLPAWVLPTTFAVAGGAVSGPLGVVTGAIGGIATAKILSPETKILPRLVSYVPKVMNASFEFSKNFIWSSATGFTKVAGVSFLAIFLFTTFTYFIIINSALVVPGTFGPNNRLNSNPAFNDVVGTCPLTNGVISCGSFGSDYPACPGGHGGNNYWTGQSSPCLYSIPIGNSCKFNNDHPKNVCYNSTSTCSTYGYATDVTSPAKTPVYLPVLNNKELEWNFTAQYNMYSGVTDLSGSGNKVLGFGRTYTSSDGENNYQIYFGHMESVVGQKILKSKEMVGKLACLGDTCRSSHVHIELKINGINVIPDSLCKK